MLLARSSILDQTHANAGDVRTFPLTGVVGRPSRTSQTGEASVRWVRKNRDVFATALSICLGES